MKVHNDDIGGEALALLEIDGVPRALLVHDEALKRAPVRVLACAPVSPGKMVLMFMGDVACVDEAFTTATHIAGSRLLDSMLLPFIHPSVVYAVGTESTPQAALDGHPDAQTNDGLAALEFATIAATLRATDAAIKGADVRIGRLHLASGYGGKGYLTLHGALCDLEAAVDCATQAAGEHLEDSEILANPHPTLPQGAFIRPWGLDPATFVR